MSRLQSFTTRSGESSGLDILDSASLYDQQAKTAPLRMKALSNKAVAEQRGVLALCFAFPEFTSSFL